MPDDPAQLTKIRLCSNILREPQVFDQLGDLAGGVARDVVIWAAWNNARTALLHLPQFCDMMGYHRRHLLRKISVEQEQELRERGWLEQHIPQLNNTLGYALTRMATQLLLFAQPLDTATKRYRYKSKRILASVDLFEKRATGTMIEFVLDEEVLENCRHRYQTISLDDYIGLKTPGNHPDDQARKMYLRCLWKRQYWDSLPVEAGAYPSRDSYTELLAVAGLHHYTNEVLAASRLRKLLERIGQLPSIWMRPIVTLNYAGGGYEVSWVRLRKNRKKSTAKVAVPA